MKAIKRKKNFNNIQDYAVISIYWNRSSSNAPYTFILFYLMDAIQEKWLGSLCMNRFFIEFNRCIYNRVGFVVVVFFRLLFLLIIFYL